MFDYKLTTEAEFKFDGINHGSAWKTKVERYMVYKAPILRELLEWAEAQDGEAISEAHMVAACSADFLRSRPSLSTHRSGAFSVCAYVVLLRPCSAAPIGTTASKDGGD